MPILWKAVLGASSQADGDSGIHTHMTHTLNTPIEALGTCFPVRVKEWSIVCAEDLVVKGKTGEVMASSGALRC